LNSLLLREKDQQEAIDVRNDGYYDMHSQTYRPNELSLSTHSYSICGSLINEPKDYLNAREFLGTREHIGKFFLKEFGIPFDDLFEQQNDNLSSNIYFKHKITKDIYIWNNSLGWRKTNILEVSNDYTILESLRKKIINN